MPTARKSGEIAMHIGDLDQRITIQELTTSRGSSGEEISTWTDWQTVWAKVETSSGSEKFYSPQLVSEATHKIKMRYLIAVKPTMRVYWRNREMDILYVDHSRIRQGEMYLLCSEVVLG